MTGGGSGFPGSYAEAALQFVAVCERNHISIEEYVHPELGPRGEQLATHVARLGPTDAPRTLVLNCGTHGVEGLAGSLCVSSWLAIANDALPRDTNALVINLINPWGAAWKRRQTEGNVDLNRNFIDFAAALPVNEFYDALSAALNMSAHDGANWSETARRLDEFRGTLGSDQLAHAIFGGQYTDPRGVGFGGFSPTWSHSTFKSIMTRHARRAQNIALIDFHTGVGPFGYGSILSTDPAESESTALARTWFDSPVVALKEDRGAIPYDVQGDIGPSVKALLPSARVIAVTLEFGTFDVDQFMMLQMQDCWLESYGQPRSSEGQRIRADLQEFFCPSSEQWRECIRQRALDVIHQALLGLAEMN